VSVTAAGIMPTRLFRHGEADGLPLAAGGDMVATTGNILQCGAEHQYKKTQFDLCRPALLQLRLRDQGIERAVY
jgi:hypothetical protein